MMDIRFTDSMGYNFVTQTTRGNDKFSFIDVDCYKYAEQRAFWYWQELQKILANEDVFHVIYKDYHQLQFIPGLNSGFNIDLGKTEYNNSDQSDLTAFFRHLVAQHKLKQYLNKSVSYIFLRDLGKSVNHKKTKKQIKAIVDRLYTTIEKHLHARQSEAAPFSAIWLHEKARDYDLHESLYWLMGKLAEVQNHLPKELNTNQSMRKLVKVIAGVFMHQLLALPEGISTGQRKHKLHKAIQLGYCYGLTYPFIDDLLDSACALEPYDKQLLTETIRTSLITGDIDKLSEIREVYSGNDLNIHFIQRELCAAFKIIRQEQNSDSAKQFFEQAFIFFEAQDIDRKRNSDNGQYTTEQLFVPIILKSAGCRIIARELLSLTTDAEFYHHTFCFGIYNQFNDDIKDIFIDMKEGNVTPYTYYLRYASKRPDLINPYKIYWVVVYFLIYRIYKNDPQTKQLLLERSINAHRSLRADIGREAYENLRCELLKTGNRKFDKMLDRLVTMSSSNAWFDKLLSCQVADYFREQQTDQALFKKRVRKVKSFIDKYLAIKASFPHKHSTLVEAANYSLHGGGKRIRSILAYIISVDQYGFNPQQIIAVLRSLEYMHTASIIFDDKPSQDNADLRRGRAALHTQYKSEAVAELTGIFMIMKAVQEQAELDVFDKARVLESLAYSAATIQAICHGQLMDLQANNKILTFEQLESISMYKTGLGIEAALVIPAILAGASDAERELLSRFARHLGIAFQIRDDMLDHQGNSDQLGKPTGQDLNKPTFVSCLGVDGANNKMFEHYYQALEVLSGLPLIRDFLSHTLNYVIYRDH